jgi:hypothetical protein
MHILLDILHKNDCYTHLNSINANSNLVKHLTMMNSAVEVNEFYPLRNIIK